MADGLIKIQGSTNVGKCVDAINDNFEYLDGKTPAGEDILEQAKADAKAMKLQAQEKSRQLDKRQEESIRQQEAVLKEEQKAKSEAEIAAMREAALQNEKSAIEAILENLV